MIEMFSKLGLTIEECKIMELLIIKGSMTVLELSRRTDIKRTTVYRLIERLENEGFVSKEIKNGKIEYEPLSLQYLNHKILSKENETLMLKELFLTNKGKIEEYYSQNLNSIGVKYYNGSEEVKQLMWNSLSTNNKKIKSFGYKSLKTAVGMKFMSEWWNESLRREIQHTLLINPQSLIEKESADKDEKYKYTDIPKELFIVKVMPFEVIPIITETFIFNDIYSII